MKKIIIACAGVGLVAAAAAYVLWVRRVTEWDEQETIDAD